MFNETQRYKLFSYRQNFFNNLSTFFFHSVDNFFWNLFGGYKITSYLCMDLIFHSNLFYDLKPLLFLRWGFFVLS